jgi:hypothetical protein
MSFQSFLQQLNDRRCRFHLVLSGNVLGDGLSRSFDQHTQHRIRICADLAGHADSLRKDVHRVRPAGDSPLNPADECVDSRESSLGHRRSIARYMTMRQARLACWPVVWRSSQSPLLRSGLPGTKDQLGDHVISTTCMSFPPISSFAMRDMHGDWKHLRLVEDRAEQRNDILLWSTGHATRNLLATKRGPIPTQDESRSRTPFARKAVSAGTPFGLPATWPHIEGMGRSSALNRCGTSTALSATSK